MPTHKQTEANRQNAQKSTGPRSAEGKAASRFNALKTGIDAKAQVIPGEDPDQLEDLVAAYQKRFSTAAPERRLLVDTLVNCDWLLRRLSRGEAELWKYEAKNSESTYSSNKHPNGRVLYLADRVFDRLQRRIDAIGRNYHRALKELQSLEAADKAEELEQPQPAAPAPLATLSKSTTWPTNWLRSANPSAGAAFAPLPTPRPRGSTRHDAGFRELPSGA